MTEPSPTLEPRVFSKPNLDHSDFTVHSAVFPFHVRTLDRIATEFGCERSNEKAVTIERGCQATADLETAKKLEGKRFLLDMSGRELPICLGSFSKETLEVINEQVPDSQNEPFIADLVGEAREAVKFKLAVKKILQYGRLLCTNQTDNNLVLFEVTTQPNGTGLVQAVFNGCVDDADKWCSMTEATNFKMED